jgi:hypothetical protein
VILWQRAAENHLRERCFGSNRSTCVTGRKDMGRNVTLSIGALIVIVIIVAVLF